MKLELIKIEDGTIVGWQLVAETREDSLRLGSVRNMQYFGLNETAVKYDGVISVPNDESLVERLTWKQLKHTDEFKREEERGDLHRYQREDLVYKKVKDAAKVVGQIKYTIMSLIVPIDPTPEAIEHIEKTRLDLAMELEMLHRKLSS